MSSTDAIFHWNQKKLKLEFQWSDLPADLLGKIWKKLHDIRDFVYFRSVCKSWRALTITFDVPPQVPWLLDRSSDASSDTEHLCFRSVFSDDRLHTIECPQSRGKILWGLLHGYHYTRKNYPVEKHSLLNPLIKHEMPLQLRKTNSRHFPLCIPSDLKKDDDYMAFVDQGTMRIEFYQPHKSKKGYIKGPRCNSIAYIGRACLKGMYFRHDSRTHNTEVFDIARRSSFVIPPPEVPSYQEDVFFVESEDSVLRIVKNFKWVRSLEYGFDIYRLDVEDKKDRHRWIKIDGIGNQILFLDCWYNFSGISVTATTESTELMKNCIYYLERYGLYKHNIKSGRTERIRRLPKDTYTWFVPSLVAFPVVS